MGDFFDGFESFQQGSGADGFEKLGFEGRHVAGGSHLRDESLGSLGEGGPDQNAIHGNSRARDGFRNTSSNGNLRSLGHTVVNHLGGNLYGRLGGDEQDSSPIFVAHTRKIVAREPDSAHHIGFEDAGPVLIGNLFERLRFKNPHVVDQDIDSGNGLDELRATCRVRNVARDARQIRFGMRFPNFGDGGVHALLRSAVHDYRGVFGRGCAGRRESDSSGRTRYQYFFACELQIHERFLPSAVRRVSAAIQFNSAAALFGKIAYFGAVY